MGQIVQIAGSLSVVAGLMLARRGVLDPKSVVSLVLNLAGSAVLAVDAAGIPVARRVWVIVSAVAVMGVLRRAAVARG